MRREADHLGEIAHRGLGHVRLPVGVSGKAGGRVPGQVRSHGGQALRIPGQEVLQALDGVGHQHADGRKAQDRKSVLAPIHLLAGFDAAQPIDEPFDGAENRIEPGAFPFKHTGQIGAHGTNACQQNQGEEGELKPAIGGHLRTSPGRAGW